MYKDFHYYGTYVAARYAGYKPKEAQIIANSAQYVDDSCHDRLIKKGDYGIDFQPIPTFHTFTELCWTTVGAGPSLSELHQVWIPFHFLPGNYESKTLPDPNASSRMRKYTGPTHDSGIFYSFDYNEKAKWEFKLLCLPESPMAIEMINDITNNHKGQPYELQLIGLRMHVFADTAAHAYYAGTPAWHVNDAGAKVYDLTVNPKKEVPWLPTPGGEQSTPSTTIYYDSIFYLGHGRMGSIPDYPWIKYEYSPKWSSSPILKDNPVEYLKIFREMVTAMKCIREGKKFDISNLEPINEKYISVVDNILRQRHAFGLDNFNMTKATDFRCGLWKEAINNGSLGPIDKLDDYKEDAWLDLVKHGQPIKQTDYYKFNKAAIIHLELVKKYLNGDGIPFNWDKTFTPDKHVQNVGISHHPGLAIYNGKLFCFHEGYGQNGQLWYTTFDETNWDHDKQVQNIGITASPALIVYNGKLYCFHEGYGRNGQLWYTIFDGTNWTPDKYVPNVGISQHPGVALHNGLLYCFHEGYGQNGQLWYTTFDGTNWAPDKYVPNVGISGSPALIVYNGKLYCFHEGYGRNGQLWYTTFDGTNWTPDIQVQNVGISDHPAIAAYNGKLYCFHEGYGQNGELWYTTFDGTSWAQDKHIQNVGISGSPALIVYNGKLYCFHEGYALNGELWYSVLEE